MPFFPSVPTVATLLAGHVGSHVWQHNHKVLEANASKIEFQVLP
jgi:hypothetical protein